MRVLRLASIAAVLTLVALVGLIFRKFSRGCACNQSIEHFQIENSSIEIFDEFDNHRLRKISEK